MKKSGHLTPGEFELMEILWPLGEASVKDVWMRLNPERGLAYTTVMTVLEKMYRKGILAQRKKGKAYLYSAILIREQALRGILEHVCDAYFGGVPAKLSSFVNRSLVAASPAQEGSGAGEADPKPLEPTK
jgi:predicted transcriptional regulator